MNKLLVICGPTATGKTSLAIKLAKKYSADNYAEIVSADSRQVYKGLDIGTGKDIPKNANLNFQSLKLDEEGIGFFNIDGVKIWGYDLVSPKVEFSVSSYIDFAGKILGNIWKRKKLPILVGGTGLYIKAVVDGIETASIPKNAKLRKSLRGKEVKELFDVLAKLDSVKSGSLNMSDKKNPRRLIRAIEIAQYKGKGVNLKSISADNELMIGLTAGKKTIQKRIKTRVEKRIREGIEDEIRNLLSSGVEWKYQAMNTLGYKEWADFNDKKKVIEQWIKDEENYAKRQITWFKKDKRIRWFDVSESNYKKRVEKLVTEWYKSK